MTFFRMAIAFLGLSFISSGCYRFRPSNGAGQTTFSGSRDIDSHSIAVLRGFRIQPVATRLTFPTGVTFDDQNRPCVVESGYAYGEVWTKPRLIRIDESGRTSEIAAGARNGPWTGVTFHNGNFYVAEGRELQGGRILRISNDGQITPLCDSSGRQSLNVPAIATSHAVGCVNSIRIRCVV